MNAQSKNSLSGNAQTKNSQSNIGKSISPYDDDPFAGGMSIAEESAKIALEKQNVELPSGKLTGANTELTVKTVGNLSKPEEFNNIIIRTDGDKIVRLSDIGGAELGPENIETSLMSSGLPFVRLERNMAYPV